MTLDACCSTAKAPWPAPAPALLTFPSLPAAPCSQGASPSRSVRWHRPVPNDEAGQGAQAVYTAMYAAVGDAERSPLALAAAGGHREAVALLLRHGAQLDLPSLRHAGEKEGGCDGVS